MEDTQNKDTDAAGTGETGNGQEPQKEEKLFTQEEVNGFIQARLTQMRKQAAKEASTEYDAKMAELGKREAKLAIREKLQGRGMPMELADVISCEDMEGLDGKIDILEKLLPKKEEEAERRGFRVGGDPGQGSNCGYDPYRRAMGLDRQEG